MGKVNLIHHPLLEHKLSIIRNKATDTKTFRENVNEIGSLVTYEVTRDLATRDVRVTTPIADTICQELAKDVVIVPILRAGLGMVDGIHDVIPTAKIGHIGIYRDEKTLEPQQYYLKLPSIVSEATILIVDPMLATGGSAVAAIDLVKKQGGKDIRFVALVGCPEGIEFLQKHHPDVDIYLVAIDDHLNENGYIVPGLGDCGDRLFGTK
ncbi:MAG TPA: uracil phosphoribosyltransferase [Bacillota bacterium]|nr:uracil phosphoribosyltransferase [Bacillota bacterium]HPJ86268.1 uracil phosphoribosyltransferase [Bacillota bacterium]HPQ62407.1 uracil phosphoribosyltransferase [Bacillota bacterium]HRX91970.1 uracil phosphoribosyltransferase [Candidatus Izemoplasmatales bacterium]